MLVLTPASLLALDDARIEELLARDEMLVVIADGEIPKRVRERADWCAVYEGSGFDGDDIVARGVEPRTYVEEWIGTRSVRALETAATLLRKNGGDALERAEFARLFATGEPQRGLRAFLEKRTPSFATATIEFL
ncbi:MAG TPA: hypothetical protein VMU84_20640 [Thermoanaerobaculia bacterium]|nr:hypothetical protein [Thermoanaerobaculia bacterium]